jgi:hypothetical protein
MHTNLLVVRFVRTYIISSLLEPKYKTVGPRDLVATRRRVVTLVRGRARDPSTFSHGRRSLAETAGIWLHLVI